MEIREELRQWRAYSVTELRERRTLSEWGAACEESLAVLKKMRALWEETSKSGKDLPGFKAVTARVRSALADIGQVEAVAEQRLRTVLDLQARLSKQAADIVDIVEQLNVSRQRVQALLFQPDAAPIWHVAPETQVDPAIIVAGRSLARAYTAHGRLRIGQKTVTRHHASPAGARVCPGSSPDPCNGSGRKLG